MSLRLGELYFLESLCSHYETQTRLYHTRNGYREEYGEIDVSNQQTP